MENIEINQATFERLQRHAKPFVDTPDIIINRALDALGLSEGHPGSSQKCKKQWTEKLIRKLYRT